MTYKELWQYSRKELELDDSTIKYMFKYYLELNDTDMANNIIISDKNKEAYLLKVKELKNGLPLQYVVGNTDFYGYKFNVKKGVLIPRPETEQLVHYTKEYIKKYFKNRTSLIDVGTGSGIIGLTLKKEFPNLEVTLTDISSKALKIASSNAKYLDEEVNIYKSNMLAEVIKRKEKYDILISNPPYLREDEEIMDMVKKNEPSIALYGGKDGLKYYNNLLLNAKKILNDRALIALEIGDNQAADLKSLAENYFNGSPYEVKKDLSEKDRMFFIFYNLND